MLQPKIRYSEITRQGHYGEGRRPILHSMDFRDMLEEAQKTELKASETYGEILPMVEQIGDSELFDALEVIYFDELRSVEELRMMLG